MFRKEQNKSSHNECIYKTPSNIQKVANFGHLLEIVGWDRAVVMPSGGAEARPTQWLNLKYTSTPALMTQPHLEDSFAQAEEETPRHARASHVT